MESSNKLLGVGSTIWIFNSNRRVYEKDKNGGPIYCDHWEPATITGETSRSWIINRYRKVPKKGPRPGVAFSMQEVEADVWINDHRYKIQDAVSRIRNADTLRAVAALVGYVA